MKPSERVGTRYGKLTIIRFSHRSPSGNYYYVCQCDCGNTKTMDFGGLRRGVVTTCGCGRKDKANTSMVGKRFGRFIITNILESDPKSGEFFLECLCDCGNIFNAISSKVNRGRISSCGCKRKNKFILDEVGNLKELTEKEKVIRQMLVTYKNGARRRNIQFRLSYNQFVDLVQKPCFYCGHLDTKTFKRTGGQYKLNGVDRINPSKDYTTKNSVTCCEQCNKAKLDYSIQDFKSWAKRLYEHTFSK